MSPLQRLREIKQRAVSLSLRAFPPETAEEAKRYAAEAYRCCVAWYGPPKDPKTPYRVEQTPGTSMLMSYLGKHYLLISQQATSPERLCEVIAHEMYHRVSVGRKGVAGEMWTQEILACLTSYWFCRRQGFSEYAEEVKKQWLSAEGRADVSLLRKSERKSRRWLLYGEESYSLGFRQDLMRVGFALSYVVDGVHVCRLSQFSTLEGWIASLPPEDQHSACRVLELPCGDKITPTSEKEWGRLYNGLKAKGDYVAMVADFERITRLQPDSYKPMFYLGRAYQGAEQIGPALEAYLKSRELGNTDRWTPQNIGNVYWHEKDYLLAAEWYGKAFEEGQQWPQARYWQGRALQRAGDLTAARAAWEQVLTLGDEQHLKKAQKALEDNPLPDIEATPNS